MIPAEKILLTVINEGEILYEKEGLFEELPIESMSMSPPRLHPDQEGVSLGTG